MKTQFIRIALCMSLGLLVFLTATCVTSAPSIQAAQPGELVEWKVATNPPVTIRFHYCPAGTIRPAKPSTATASENLPPPTQVRDFYLGETEVTLAQFRAVLGDAGLAPLKAQAAKVQTTNPELFDMLQRGQDEPAFFVGLDGAVDFCNRLQTEFDDFRAKMAQPSVDTRMFRLPSHVEWQYAARGIAASDQQAAMPHFGRWIRFAELSPANQQKCQEVWQSLGHGGPFSDNQDAFLELARTTDAAQQEKVKEILTEAFGKAFGSARRQASGISTLQPVGKTRANAWNLTDMHEGVSEWTIWATKPERARDLWLKLTTARKSAKPLIDQEDVFLSGGSFSDSYFGAKALSRFTVWGGPKLTDDQPQPFSFQAEIVLDTVPGFRVLMERVVADDWLFALRRGVFEKRLMSANAPNYLKSSNAVVLELTESDHPARSAVEFYSELAASRTAVPVRFGETLKKVAQMRPTPSSGGSGSAASKLAALVKKTNETSTPGESSSSDEGDYFQALAAVVQLTPK